MIERSRALLAGVTLAALMVGVLHAEPQPDGPGTAASLAASLGAATNRAIAARAAALLETRYVVPAMGRRYALALRRHASHGDYATLKDPASLAARMTADLQAVAPDAHLRFYTVQLRSPDGAVQPSVPADGWTLPGIRDMRWLEPGVAYISFEHFDDRPEAMTAVAAFIKNHAHAQALVIDSRGNSGGAFDMMGLLANHLFATPRLLANMDMSSAVVAQYGVPLPVDGQTLRRKNGPPGMVRFEHWAGPAADDAWFGVPVYYLTSRQTLSAAEHLAMILKSSGRALLIGEPTAGGNHFGGTEPVGGGLELFVPVGHTTDPATGLDWETIGVAPHVAVPAADALGEALRRVHSTAPAA